MQRLILDTSSIVYAFSNKIDIFEAIEDRLEALPVISSGVVSELKMLASTKRKEGRAARIALEILKKHKVEVVKDDRKVDAWVLSAGSKVDVYVCTNDILLKRALRSRGKQPLSVSEDGSIR